MDDFKKEIEKAKNDIFDKYCNILGEFEVNYSGELDFVSFQNAYYICSKFEKESNNTVFLEVYKEIASKFYPNRSEIEFINKFNLMKNSVIFGMRIFENILKSK